MLNYRTVSGSVQILEDYEQLLKNSERHISQWMVVMDVNHRVSEVSCSHPLRRNFAKLSHSLLALTISPVSRMTATGLDSE